LCIKGSVGTVPFGNMQVQVHSPLYLPKLLHCTKVVPLYQSCSIVPKLLHCTKVVTLYQSCSIVPKLLHCIKVVYVEPRLFRVLTKLCTVVDRAELNGDYSWSDYGDCYMLKLFRDYVFHQVLLTLKKIKRFSAIIFFLKCTQRRCTLSFWQQC
jgi:hypothetical protein